MAIYTNEHLTDLLNEQYEKVRELEKELQATKEQLKKCESALDDYATCKDVGATARRYFIDKQKDEVK